MATAEDASGGDALAEAASSARDFIVTRLDDADSSLSPSELAEEYGCSNGHCRNVVAKLRKEGTIRRVGDGLYELASDESERSGEEVLAGAAQRFVGEGDSAGKQSVQDLGDEDGESDGDASVQSDDPSVDGGHRSEDTVTGENGDTEIVDGDGLDDLDESSMVSTEQAAGAAAAGGAGLLAVSDSDTQKWVLIGLAVGAVAYLWWRSRSSTSDQRNQQDEYGGELDGYDGELSEDDFNHFAGDPAEWAR
jgi:hypothetical protein